MPRLVLCALVLASCTHEADLGPHVDALDAGSTDALKPSDTPLGDYTGPPPPGGLDQESSWCWTAQVRDDRLALVVVGMDTGRVEVAARFLSDVWARDHALTWHDGRFITRIDVPNEHLYNVWTSLDPATGDWELGRESDARTRSFVATHEGRLYVMGDFPDVFENERLAHYDDFDAMLDGDGPIHNLDALPNGTTSRGTIADGMIVGAWHSGRFLTFHDIEDGSQLGRIRLEGYNDWIWGVSGAGGMFHVVDDGRQIQPAWTEAMVARFDRDGNRLGRASFPMMSPSGRPYGKPTGLWCDARE